MFLLVLLAVAVGVVLNRQWLYDFYRVQTYQPSSEMSQIRESLDLTERGEFLFNASQPVLNGSDEFNAHCQSGDTEIAILGCYTGGNIYIYNITEAELDGIRELTTAHELLHVVFARMTSEEKASLKPLLEQVYQNNQEILEEDLNTYDESERFEELYVRAGTEVAALPEALEKHYAEVFEDQDKVVAFYNDYNGVFRALKAELDSLAAEMEALNVEIAEKTAEYEDRFSQLNANVVSFNSCAEVAGCFATEAEFYARRDVLVAEQEALESLYNELNGLINTYNAKVEVYNADVLQSQKLNTMINSNSKPAEIR